MELVEIKTKNHMVTAKTDHGGIYLRSRADDHPVGDSDQQKVEIVDAPINMTRPNCLEKFFEENFDRIVLLGKVLLFTGYFVYFGFALNYHIGDEGSWRLIGCTIFGLLIIAWDLFKKTECYMGWTSLVDNVYDEYLKGKRRLVVRWFLYVAMTTFIVVYVVLYVAMETPANLWSLLGLFGFPFLLFLFSKNRSKVNWHTVYWSMALQFTMALLILKTSWGASIIQWVGDRLEAFISNGAAGSKFVFGQSYMDHAFAFGSLVQVFVLIVGMSVLTYLGAIKFVVETLGRALAFCIGTSPPEGINAVGNIFLHVVTR